MRRGRRHVRVPPDLTSLFDVLFIVIFAALIRAAAVEKAAANPPPPKPLPPPVRLEARALRAQALDTLDQQLAARPVVVVRIAAAGTLTAIEVGDNITKLDTPLLEKTPDPDVGLAYLGERSADQRICRQVALQLRAGDLAPYLVIIAPDKHLADLPHALYEGLRHDVDHCLDQKGLAVLVDPTLDASAGSDVAPGSGSEASP